MVKYNNLPKDIQEEIVNLAQQYPFTIEEVCYYYLMGGEFTDELCQLRLRCYPESFIKLYNQALWDTKNKKILDELREHESKE